MSTPDQPALRSSGVSPPPLPPVRSGVAYIVVPGTVVWLAAFVVLLFFTDSLRAADATIWLWTCLAGFLLGLLGLSIFAWQRAAARRGHRGAQTSALE